MQGLIFFAIFSKQLFGLYVVYVYDLDGSIHTSRLQRCESLATYGDLIGFSGYPVLPAPEKDVLPLVPSGRFCAVFWYFTIIGWFFSIDFFVLI